MCLLCTHKTAPLLACISLFDVPPGLPAPTPSSTKRPTRARSSATQMQGILRRLDGLNFVGMDVVEVSPAYDHAEITSVAAASVIFEYLSVVRP
jgi:agmatinase